MLRKMSAKFFLPLFVALLVAGGPALAASSDEAAGGRVIAYPAGYDTTKEGASSYNGIGNVENSPYFPSLDVYNLQPTATLTILPRYKTYQQTTEITCGPAAALTVLHHFGNTSWQEKEIAKIMATKAVVGTDTQGMVAFFKAIGWDVKSSLTSANKEGVSFAKEEDFKNFVLENLRNNTPIMVENIDWSGHWRVIIGYDTMGTDTLADDVLIMADSYDTGDHKQDGYVVQSSEKFYYMWFDAHMLPKGQQTQQWLSAKPR
ncbi:C39 family peptidase [Azotosporobacter soli]|uniref:C39 family peptidase n=1 Tax=Azotosporobacter soli TaxID=3055040 RepID=UPI0031FEEC04